MRIRRRRFRLRSRRSLVLAFAIAVGLVASGCGAEAGRVVGVALKADGARFAAARAGTFSETGAMATISARSALRVDGSGQGSIAVRSEASAAATVEASAPMRATAQNSAQRIDGIARETTTGASAAARIKACARSGAVAAARGYADEYVEGHPPPAVKVTLAQSIGGCLAKSFPNQAPQVRAVTTAVVSSMLNSTQQVADARATAQDYTDWLVYTGSLYREASAAAPAQQLPAPPSAVDTSVDALLVVLFHSHAGRVAAEQGDWPTAIANRAAVLGELSQVSVAPELEPARGVLVAAMQASLASDRSHARCGLCAAPYDAQATAVKQRFVALFDPYVQARYGRGLDHSQV
jgi:hypothetical protein